MTLRQRRPASKNKKHLSFVRSLPCCICQRTLEVDAAHIRAGSPEHDKLPCGMQERDDDWVTPLCRLHHTQQHNMPEMDFWRLYKIDPFLLAKSLRKKHGTPDTH